MNSQQIEKLSKVDQIMFSAYQTREPQDEVLKAGRLLCELSLLEEKDADKVDKIIDAYNKNVFDQIQKITRNKKTAVLNMQTLNHYEDSDDELEADLAKNCRVNFKKYAQIVLRFDDKIDAWRKEESGEKYRQLVHDLDSRRTSIHNDCLSDIKVINRMAEQDGLEPLVEYYNGITRTDIGTAIIKQYYNDLTKNEQKIKDN